MRALWAAVIAMATFCQAATFVGQTKTANGLEVRYGAKGLERLTYRGEVLADVGRWPEDEFHIWHMKCIDGRGKPLTEGEYGWGEQHQSRVWNAAAHSWTYHFQWGTIVTAYVQRGDALDVKVTETNRADSGVVLDGASVYPITLHLPGARGGTQIASGLDAPAVTLESWNGGEVAAVAPDASKVLYSGFQAGKEQAMELLISGTKPDALQDSAGRGGRSVKPGETDSFVVSLRFGESGVMADRIGADALESYAKRWPQVLHWKDRRVIGSVFLASSPQGDKTHASGFPMNPRRFFKDASLDVRSAAGLQEFQRRVLKQAEAVVTNLRRLNGQGAITWDLEGEEYPQDTSYVCAPDEIARVAPEMESVLGLGERYAGMKLDDAYFKTIRDAGFQVGVCVRPQRFLLSADGTARQESLSDEKAAEELMRKMRYAHERWGVRIFYLDSTVRADGTTLPAEVIEEAAKAVPDSLLIPEESSARMYRVAAPFKSLLFHGETGTDESVRSYYPQAFSVNMVNDVDPAKLEQERERLVKAVRDGDVLMVHAGYWHPNNEMVVEIYRAAGGARK